MIFGIGTDLVEVPRIEKTLETFGEKFIKRVLTPEEKTQLGKRKNLPLQCAKIFSAKEAFLKALGTGLSQGISWQDINVERKSTGQPFFNICGQAQQILSSLTPPGMIATIHLSISDQGMYALAFVVIDFINK